MAAPRSAEQRKTDTLARLDSDADAWLSTADASGDAYLLPLSFYWDGRGVVFSTPRSSVTARNLSRGGRVRVGLGELRDVTLIEGLPEVVEDEPTKEAFATKHGWDPRKETNEYVFFRIVAARVQAWREVNELAGRTLMSNAEWLT
jgi:general stress protein 26